MFETSQIELSLSALKKNIRFLKRLLPTNTVFSSVIKGNAYGHGISLIVPMAEQCGIRHFSVFSADEARKAKRSKTAQSQIMIMGAIDNDELAWAIERDISFYVFEMDRLRAAQKTAKGLGKKARIHMEIETGMNRLGFQSTAVKKALSFIMQNHEHLTLEGVCTHYAGSESIDNYLRIQNQIQHFNEQCIELASQGVDFKTRGTIRHTACSAAALTYPNTVMDMVRIGIAQYGFWPSKETEIQFFLRKKSGRRRSKTIDPLIRVIKWKSAVMSTKRIKRGDYVGYGSSSLITRPARIASVPIGYADGFFRALSNKGYVLVRGKPAPVAGMVNMNMLMIDVTDIKGVRKGDEVVIIGKQGDNTISVGAFGELTRFINYELLVGLPSEIPRKVVN